MCRLPRWVAASILVLFLAVSGLAPACAFGAVRTTPGLYVPSSILITSDGTVLWSKNPTAGRRVASTIKLLNALVARDQADLDKVITVDRAAAAIDNGTVELKAGQKLTVRELLGIMLVHSANDAADALAIGIAGSEKKYVVLMNQKAKQLGLKDTHAADSNGLGGHETCCAADLATLARYVLADPVLRGIVGQTKVLVPRPNGKNDLYWTTDRLLGSYPGIEGVKTGYTDAAGYCFVGAAKRGGVELIGVVLGADVGSDRFTQMRKLLDWGFAHSKLKQLVSSDTTMGAVEVDQGVEPTITVHAERPLSMTAFDFGGRVSTQVSLPPAVKAPIAAGQVIGAVQVSRDGTIVASVPLVADSGVAQAAGSGQQSIASSALGLSGRGWSWLDIARVWAGLGRMLGI